MTEADPILSISGLSMDFPARSAGKKAQLHALQNVSFDLYKGETLGVIGESGCGKSTLARCIMRLHKPTAGSILYGGLDLAQVSEKELKALRRDIQMVFQDPYSSLNPRKTAGQIVGEPLRIHHLASGKREIEEKTLHYLKQVGLDIQHVNRYPHEFSGGQRQRLNIARALSLNPKILVCDEPVSALDVSIQAQVLNLLLGLQQELGLSYIFISHDLSVIRHISDRIAIMYLGSIVELCSASEIYEHPMHPYTQALLSAIPPSSPFEKKDEIVLEGDIPSPIGERTGCPLASRCPKCTQQCREKAPELKLYENGHYVACHLYE